MMTTGRNRRMAVVHATSSRRIPGWGLVVLGWALAFGVSASAAG